MPANSPFRAGSGSRLLRLYGYYSLVLSLLIIIVDGIDKEDQLLGSRAPNLFLILSSFYVICAATFVAIANRRKDSQAATSYMFLETTLLTGMMYASGGLEAGFSSLLLIPVIAANLLAPGVLGYSVAAWLSLGVIYTQHIVHQTFGITDTANTGVYGLISFAIAAITQLLSRRISTALDLAENQALTARRLQRLSQQALMTLPDGIIACEKSHRVLFFNRQASDWFPLFAGAPVPAELASVSHQQTIAHEPPLTVSRISIPDTDGDYLLLIEDESRIAAQAQQIKLASLGRLTASIAHEIRNPLSALSQASQLLQETPGLSDQDRRLTRMIEDNSQRINRTIVDILQLSRGRRAEVQPLSMTTFLESFYDQFAQVAPENLHMLKISCDKDVRGLFDPGHLLQILNNLTLNAARYAGSGTAAAEIRITAQVSQSGHTELIISDTGCGISDDVIPHLFEPFNTSEHSGTGLGLYLCRELCHANQADIQFTGNQPGAVFRIHMRPAS